MSWFRRKRTPRTPLQEKTLQIPEGVWRKCDSCKEVLYAKAIQQAGQVCPRCGFHFAISVDDRMALLLDPGSSEEIETNLYPVDPLKFKDQVAYRDRLLAHQERTGRADAVVVVRARLLGHQVIACFMDFQFMGGSLGSVVGEKIARGAEHALTAHVPLLITCASGGARMQEGALSLMQMAKINSVLVQLREAGVPYVSILTNPTTGGVSASFAMAGDLIVAEPGALIGFAGPRVIEQTIRQVLPEGFQRAEFLLAHGMVDAVVPRRDLRQVIGRCLSFFTGQPCREPAPSESATELSSRHLPLADDATPPTTSPDPGAGIEPDSTGPHLAH